MQMSPDLDTFFQRVEASLAQIERAKHRNQMMLDCERTTAERILLTRRAIHDIARTIERLRNVPMPTIIQASTRDKA
jgi:hypothetical protein